MKKLLLWLGCLLFAASVCRAVLIVPFPGLDALIKQADAIVTLEIHEVIKLTGPDGYFTARCVIYQSLKGDIPREKEIVLQLTGWGTESFGLHSAHLVFLAKKPSPNEPTEYLTLPIEGAQLRLSPLANERLPEGKTVREQVQSLVARAKTYWNAQQKKENELFDMMLAGSGQSASNADKGGAGLNSDTIRKLSLLKPYATMPVTFLSSPPDGSPGQNIEAVALKMPVAEYKAPSSDGAYPVAAITVAALNRIYLVRGPEDDFPVFYMMSGKDLLICYVGGSIFNWEQSYMAADIAEEAKAIARFEQTFDAEKLEAVHMAGPNRVNFVSLREAATPYFFSDAPAPGGGGVIMRLDAVRIEKGQLCLAVTNPVTKKSATFWINWQARKVVRAVVDGQEMDISTASPSGAKPQAEPMSAPSSK